MKYSMASTKHSTLRPRNIQISYKNACGAPAPQSSLLKNSSNSTKNSRGKKALKITNTESLFYTHAGDRISSGVVSHFFFFFLFFSLIIYLYSGAVAVEMVARLLFVPLATRIHFVQSALILDLTWTRM